MAANQEETWGAGAALGLGGAGAGVLSPGRGARMPTGDGWLWTEAQLC